MDHMNFWVMILAQWFISLSTSVEKLFVIPRFSAFLLRQHCSISRLVELPLESICSLNENLCLFDIRINQSYFEDLVKLEDEELMFYLILKLILYFFNICNNTASNIRDNNKKI